MRLFISSSEPAISHKTQVGICALLVVALEISSDN